MNEPSFRLVGKRQPQLLPPKITGSPVRRAPGRPLAALTLLAVIGGCCLCAELLMTHDPTYLNLTAVNHAPGREFFFGTDALGRDVFSMIFYGGRLSLLIGLLATAISSLLAVSVGTLAGLSAEWLDDLLMRGTEILLSLPSLLLVILLQALWGKSSIWSLAVLIGVTGWMNVAKIVRSEVRQLAGSEYILSARAMGGGFFYLLRRHFLPNMLPAIMFMLVTNVGSAIGAEATLSFLGVGLPVEIISWGSMLSMADRALLTNCWWVIVFPGMFLVLTLVCLADIGNYLRGRGNKKDSFI